MAKIGRDWIPMWCQSPISHLVEIGDNDMSSTITVLIAATLTVGSLASCGNTIRGMGKDTANTVDATQNAGTRVGKAAKN
jgi:entericidin B